MKYLIGAFFFTLLLSCNQKNKVSENGFVVEGIISKPSFDKLIISDLSKIYLDRDLVLNTSTNGYVGDTLFTPHKGIFMATYADKNFVFYAEPGAKIQFKTDFPNFNKNLKFEGDFAEDNNFLSATSSSLSDTVTSWMTTAYSLKEDAFFSRVDSVKTMVKNFIDSKKTKGVNDLVYQFVQNRYSLDIYNIVNQYPMLHQQFDNAYKPNAGFVQKNPIPTVSDSLVAFLPNYRQYLLQSLEEPLQLELKANEAQINANKVSPVYLLLNVLSKNTSLSAYKKDYLIGSFASNFDYANNNPLLKQVNDTLQKVVKNNDIKGQLEDLYKRIEGTKKGIKALNINGIDIKDKPISLSFNQPTLLYFYTTTSPNLNLQADNLISLQKDYAGKMQIIAVNFDKESDWKFFMKNRKWNVTDVHIPQRWHSNVASFYNCFFTNMPHSVLINKDGTVSGDNYPEINTEAFRDSLNVFLPK